MERKYTILAILLIVLATGLVVLPGKNDRKETDPKALLNSIAEKSRYLTVDLVTQRIIEKDPTLLLIDLRPANQFSLFALPGAVNVLPDSLFSVTNHELLNQAGKDKVFYANSDLSSEKAWLLCTRYSIGRLYIMKGGLNEWYNTIIKEAEVGSAASSADIDLLSFRNAARQYFTGAGQPTEKTSAIQTPEKIQVVRKAPRPTSGGGC